MVIGLILVIIYLIVFRLKLMVLELSFSIYQFNYENWTYSGYYLFDSLWVKINGIWNYLLALFDVKLNTLVSIKLVESEDSKTIYQFLNESLRNQKKISIGTDLKHEYREAIDKLNIKHHFCRFHVKQNLNKRFKEQNQLLMLKQFEIN